MNCRRLPFITTIVLYSITFSVLAHEPEDKEDQAAVQSPIVAPAVEPGPAVPAYHPAPPQPIEARPGAWNATGYSAMSIPDMY